MVPTKMNQNWLPSIFNDFFYYYNCSHNIINAIYKKI